jgi:hypothetical protein
MEEGPMEKSLHKPKVHVCGKLFKNAERVPNLQSPERSYLFN